MKQDYNVFHLTAEEHWLVNCWIHEGADLVSVIARERGWLPLMKGEEMTVHYNGRKYVIKREE